MKDKIDEITYNLELGCINHQEASKQLFDLYVVVDTFFCKCKVYHGYWVDDDNAKRCNNCDLFIAK